MKKITILLILLVLITGCGSTKGPTELTSEKAISKIESKETFVLVVGTTTCASCVEYAPIVNEVIKNSDIEIFNISLDKDSSSQERKDYLSDELLGKIIFTPTTFVINEGEVVFKKTGVIEYRALKEVLVEYGFIEK